MINPRFSTLKIEKLKGNFYETDMELKAIVQDANVKSVKCKSAIAASQISISILV